MRMSCMFRSQFMLAVVQPQSTGIGGGSVTLLYKAATRELRALDGREEAPAAFHPDVFCEVSDDSAPPRPYSLKPRSSGRA